jgi:hypothetical protein
MLLLRKSFFFKRTLAIENISLACLERWVTGGGSSQTGMLPTGTFSPLTFKQINSIVL